MIYLAIGIGPGLFRPGGEPPVVSAPAIVGAPSIQGSGLVGTPHAAADFVVSGYPWPANGFQWQRNGTDIPGAVAASYTPGAEDDGTALTCIVSASNSEGSASTVTPAVAIRRAAPVAGAALADQAWSEGSGVQVVDAAAGFEGEALVFSLASPVPGVSVDAGTGLVSVDTAATGAVSGVQVVVRGANSGGAVESAFGLTVVAAGSRPVLLLIVAGQSNALVDGTGPGNVPAGFEAITDAYIWTSASGSFAPLAPGVNSGPYGASQHWGDESAIARAVNQAEPGREIYIVKRAENGALLAPAASNSWHPSLGATRHFGSLRSEVAAARAALAAAGRTWEEITTWCQGEADTKTAEAAAAYRDNLDAFLAAYRSDISAGRFLIQRIRPYSGELAVKTYANQFAVRKAQEDVAAADPDVGIISLDFAPSNFGNLHPGAAWAAEKGLRAHAWYAGTHDATYGAVADSHPENLGFADENGVEAGAVRLSDPLAPAIGQHAAVSIGGGEYRILNPDDTEAVGWTSAPAVIHPFQKLQLRAAAPATPGASAQVDVSVGSAVASWRVTAEAAGAAREAETTAFAAALAAHGGTAMSPVQETALDGFYAAAKISTWWPKMHRIYVSLHDVVASSIDLADRTTLATACGNNGDALWTRGLGFHTGGASGRGRDLKLNPKLATQRDSVAIGVWYSGGTAISAGSSSADIMSDSTTFRIWQTSGGALNARLHAGSAQSTGGVTLDPGLRVVSRTGAAETTFYGPQGGVVGTSAAPSVAPEATALSLFVSPSGGGTTNQRSVAAAFVSAGLSGAEVSSLNTALAALLAAFA
jgi:hypothetical protein